MMFSHAVFLLCGTKHFVEGDFKLVLECGGAKVTSFSSEGKRKRCRQMVRTTPEEVTAVVVEDPGSKLLQGDEWPDSLPVLDYKKLLGAMETNTVASLLQLCSRQTFF